MINAFENRKAQSPQAFVESKQRENYGIGNTKTKTERLKCVINFKSNLVPLGVLSLLVLLLTMHSRLAVMNGFQWFFVRTRVTGCFGVYVIDGIGKLSFLFKVLCYW